MACKKTKPQWSNRIFLLLLIILKVFGVIKSLIKVIQVLICLDGESPAVVFQEKWMVKFKDS